MKKNDPYIKDLWDIIKEIDMQIKIAERENNSELVVELTKKRKAVRAEIMRIFVKQAEEKIRKQEL